MNNFLSLLVCLFLLIQPSAQAAEKRVALVIGNSAYPTSPLTNPVNDAKDIAAALRKLDFTVIEKTDASQKEMNRAIAQFGEKLTNDTVALFYYAGHGMQVKGKNYLIPVDAQIASEASARVETVDVDSVLDQLGNSPFNIVILDACRNNPFERRFRSTSGGLAQMDAPKGTLIAYATAPGKVASDGSGRNGLYTQELLKNLHTPGLPLEAVFKRVRNGVMQASGDAQTPWESSSLTGDFYFIFTGSTTVNVQTPAAPAPPVTRLKSNAEIEQELWDSIKDANSSEALNEYLRHYPKGKYVAQAKILLAKLKKDTRAEPLKAATATPNTGSPDDALWTAVERGNSADDYDAYLNQYPKGKYAALAKSRKQKLEEHAQREAIQKEQDAWNNAESGNSEEAYNAYLKAYPAGQYVQLAQGRIRKLKADAKARAEQEARQRETEALQREAEVQAKAEQALWQQAEQSNDKASVNAYLAQYPAGRYASEARQTLARIEKEEAELRPGKVFKDCADCPEMVVIPAGSFVMGSPVGETGKPYQDREGPLHTVRIAHPFAMGKTEVTQGQWRAIMGDNPSEFKQCGDNCPVEKVSWEDAQEYIGKLNAKTGKRYRLPSEAEWEYAARAGTSTPFYTGNCVNTSQANYDGNYDYGNCGAKTRVYRKQTMPAGSFAPNGFGLYDMIGNVWEWVEDCWNDNYNGAPTDGSTRTGGDCGRRVLRGGSWYFDPDVARSARRGSYDSSHRDNTGGLRVSRTLP